jgi:hypothetical protein
MVRRFGWRRVTDYFSKRFESFGLLLETLSFPLDAFDRPIEYLGIHIALSAALLGTILGNR